MSMVTFYMSRDPEVLAIAKQVEDDQAAWFTETLAVVNSLGFAQMRAFDFRSPTHYLMAVPEGQEQARKGPSAQGFTGGARATWDNVAYFEYNRGRSKCNPEVVEKLKAIDDIAAKYRPDVMDFWVRSASSVACFRMGLFVKAQIDRTVSVSHSYLLKDRVVVSIPIQYGETGYLIPKVEGPWVEISGVEAASLFNKYNGHSGLPVSPNDSNVLDDLDDHDEE